MSIFIIYFKIVCLSISIVVWPFYSITIKSIGMSVLLS